MYGRRFVQLFLAAPAIAAGQNSPPSDKQLSIVQTQLRNVRYHFSDDVAVEIKSLNGELVPVSNNEFPIFDDKNSLSLRISAAEIVIDSSNLANVLNSYVFARPHSPLTELSIIVANGRLKVKGSSTTRGTSRSRRREFSVPLPTENFGCIVRKLKPCMFRSKG
jgi:hypothetical protein